MNSSESFSIDEQNNSYQDQDLEFNAESPEFSSKSKLLDSSSPSPIKPTTNRSINSILEERCAQLSAVTLPSDKSQLRFLNSLESETSPLNKLSIFLDYLIEKTTSMSLEAPKYTKEIQSLKEKLKLAENKNSRLLLHLQQNVKILTKVATNEDETTLIQEAAQTYKSIENFTDDRKHDYIKQLNKTLQQKPDPKAALEILELLKQEISINAILRKQTQSLHTKSSQLVQSLKQLKTQFETISSERYEKQISKLKNQSQKQQTLLTKLATMANCGVDNLEQSMQQIIQSSSTQQKALEHMKKKIDSFKKENETKLVALKNENNELKQLIAQKDSTNKKCIKIRNVLCEELGITSKYTSEPEGLISAATKSLEYVKILKQVCAKTSSEPSNVEESITALAEANERLERMQKQNRLFMKKQGEVIQELQDNSWKQWGISMVGTLNVPEPHKMDDLALREILEEKISSEVNKSVDATKSDDFPEENSTEYSSHFGELNELRNQFSSIEKELVQLQDQMKAKLDESTTDDL